jgi:hypothetical protein
MRARRLSQKSNLALSVMWWRQEMGDGNFHRNHSSILTLGLVNSGMKPIKQMETSFERTNCFSCCPGTLIGLMLQLVRTADHRGYRTTGFCGIDCSLAHPVIFFLQDPS